MACSLVRCKCFFCKAVFNRVDDETFCYAEANEEPPTPRDYARLIELLYFAGLTGDEAAARWASYLRPRTGWGATSAPGTKSRSPAWKRRSPRQNEPRRVVKASQAC